MNNDDNNKNTDNDYSDDDMINVIVILKSLFNAKCATEKGHCGLHTARTICDTPTVCRLHN